MGNVYHTRRSLGYSPRRGVLLKNIICRCPVLGFTLSSGRRPNCTDTLGLLVFTRVRMVNGFPGTTAGRPEADPDCWLSLFPLLPPSTVLALPRPTVISAQHRDPEDACKSSRCSLIYSVCQKVKVRERRGSSDIWLRTDWHSHCSRQSLSKRGYHAKIPYERPLRLRLTRASPLLLSELHPQDLNCRVVVLLLLLNLSLQSGEVRLECQDLGVVGRLGGFGGL